MCLFQPYFFQNVFTNFLRKTFEGKNKKNLACELGLKLRTSSNFKNPVQKLEFSNSN